MPDTLSAEDTIAVHEVIARYVHINDNYRDDLDALEQLKLVFAENIVWEGHDGKERLEGLEAVRARYLQTVERQKAADVPFYMDHHVTSTIITSFANGQVRTRTHYITVKDDRTAGSGDYLHVLERTDDGWRIVERKNVHRLPPLETPRPADVYDGWEIV